MIRDIWFHALGARAGGGLTYFHAVVPEMARQVAARGGRLVLLLPEGLDPGPLEGSVTIRRESAFSGGGVRRLLYDQVLLPLRLRRNPGSVLFGSGSFVPVAGAVRRVVLLRNAIYFDADFLERETRTRRLSLGLQERLIAAGAARCSAVHYPTAAMRDLVEARHPSLKGTGVVNPYGIAAEFAGAGPAPPPVPRSDGRLTFLCVLNYTLQKNLGWVLEALGEARALNLPVRVVVTSSLESGPRSCFRADRALIDRHDLVHSGYLVPAGPRLGKDLLKAYAEADAVLFPSICESFGHPLVEAMALGKPLIVADRPYAREMCGRHALYLDPVRPGSLVETWRGWPGAVTSIPPVPRGELETRFSWRRHVERLLESLLGGGDSRP